MAKDKKDTKIVEEIEVIKEEIIEEAKEEKKETVSKSNTMPFIIIIIVLVLIIIAGAIFVITRPGNSTPNGAQLKIDKNAGSYVETTTTAKNTQGVAIPGWGSMTIPAGVTELNGVNLSNPEANDGLYYLSYELRLPTDNEQGYEVIFSTDLIPPGQTIQSVTMKKALSAGTYDAIIHVQPYTMDGTMTNNADMKTTIYVK